MIKHFMTLLNQEPSLYAEVGEAAFGLGRHNLSSFGGSYRSGGIILYIYFNILILYFNFLILLLIGMMSEPAPYATTTLAMNSKMRTLVCSAL